MDTWRTTIASLASLISLTFGAVVYGADPSSVSEAGEVSPQERQQAPINRSSRATSVGRIPRTASERIAQERREIEMQRRQREIEVDALRSVRKADREAWRKRWDEQRQRAREESLEREQRYLRELGERSPELAAHRKRHAKELERRRQSFEEKRRARWKALDRLED